MPSNESGPAEPRSAVPSMLDLVRLSRKRLFPPGGVQLYRQIALLTEMSPGLEVLDVASGKGVPLEYFVKEFGVTASGVDIDPEMVEEAEDWSRELGAGLRLQFQSGRSDALPYRDDIFDIAIGEIGLANHCSPEDAVRELVRVTRPGGFVVLVQLVWKAPVDDERRRVLSQHLGARPLMLVEWKRLLREAGVQDVHVEDWSDEETSFRPTVAKPFPDFAELFSLGERISILHRAWQRWGLKGVTHAISRENEVHNLLTSERILGLDLLRGRKVGGVEAAPAGVAAGEARGVAGIELGAREQRGRRPASGEGATTDRSGSDDESARPARPTPGEGSAAGHRSAPATPEDTGGPESHGTDDEPDQDGTHGEPDRNGTYGEPDGEDDHAETVGLPLFGGGRERGDRRSGAPGEEPEEEG